MLLRFSELLGVSTAIFRVWVALDTLRKNLSNAFWLLLPGKIKAGPPVTTWQTRFDELSDTAIERSFRRLDDMQAGAGPS